MATYSGTVTTNKPTDNAHAKGYLTYESVDASETATTITYKFNMYLKFDDNTTSLNYAWLAESYYNWTGTGGQVDKQYTFPVGTTGSGTNHLALGATWSSTFTKQSTEQTLTRALSVEFPAGSSSVHGAEQSYTITIPASVSYTLTYNPTQGSGGPTSQTFYPSAQFNLSSSTPSRYHYSFAKWATTAGGTGIYAAGATIPANTFSGNTTLYADWTFNTYSVKVTYNGNGGTGTPASTTIYDSESMQDIFAWSPASMADRQNSVNGQVLYKFLGWSQSQSATSPSYISGGTYNISNSMTVYAVWQYQPQSYKITYNTMGGANGPTEQTWQCTTESGTSVTLSATVPTKSGFTFLGWAKTSSATTPTYTAGQTATFSNSDGNFTLYAVWDVDSSYTYTQGSIINSQWRTFMMYKITDLGTSIKADIIAGLHVTGNQTTTDFTDKVNGTEKNTVSSTVSATARITGLKLPITTTSFTWEKGAGARTVSFGSTLYAGSASGTTSTCATSITIPSVASYPVTYNANGGSSAPATQYKFDGFPLTLTTQQPVRASYRFLGWDTDPTATEPTYVGGDVYTANAPLDLYAVWTLGYYETIVQGISNATDVCEWDYDTIAVISGTSIYRVDVGGNVVGPITIDAYTGTAKLCYSNGQLVVMTGSYTAFISAINQSITYDTNTIIQDAKTTTYGLFGLTSTKGVGTLTVPSR